jgi:RsiW-degrading membrane proteinase PrsW (M82 family)
MQTLILLVLLIIVGSLGSALYYLLKDRGRSPRTVKALTFRIGLSLGLFILLLLGYQFGLLQPHGLKPGAHSATAPSAVPPAAAPPAERP